MIVGMISRDDRASTSAARRCSASQLRARAWCRSCAKHETGCLYQMARGRRRSTGTVWARQNHQRQVGKCRQRAQRNPRTRPCVRVPRARLLFADRSLEDVTEEYSRTRGTYCNVLIVSTVTLPLLYTRCAAVRLRFHTVTGVAGRRPGSSGHQQGMLVE